MGILIRLARALEREARLLGIDIEVEITAIIDKLAKANGDKIR